MGFYEAKRNAIFIFLINEIRFPLTRQISVAFFRRPTRLNSFVRLARCRRPRRARREAITKQCEPSLVPRVSGPLQAPAGRPPGGPAGRPSQNNVNLALFLLCLARCRRPPGEPPEGSLAGTVLAAFSPPLAALPLTNHIPHHASCRIFTMTDGGY